MMSLPADKFNLKLRNMSKQPKKKNYNIDNIPLAIASIRDGMSIKNASGIYGIPRSTLSDKLHNKYNPDKTKPGWYLNIMSFFHHRCDC